MKMNAGRILSIATVIAVLLIVAMPSSDSVWTDEGQTYHYAKESSFRSWHLDLVSDKESEALMPLGMWMPWLEAKVLGTAEWSMRAPNIFWALMALIPIVMLGRQFSLPWLPLLFAVQPFLWFYSNEARPYVMQIAEGAWLFLALMRYLEDDSRNGRWAWCFMGTGFLLCCTSLLGVIPFCAMLAVGAVVLFKRGIPPRKSAWLSVAASAPLLLALGVYYLWALHRGAQSSKVWSVNVSNLAFSMYELFGFAGLGPGRVALRGAAQSQTNGVTAHLFPYLPGIVALVVVYGAVLAGFFRALRRPERALWLLVTTAVVVTSATGLALLAFVAHFPFWGRHLAPVFPAIVFLVALSLQSLRARPAAKFGVAASLCLLLLISSLELRFSGRHKKDDYRTADHLAQAELASGKRVWWFADVWASRYYGLDVTISNPRTSGMLIRPDGYLGRYQQLPAPDLIVLSKPDIYDKTGSLREFIRHEGYHQTSEAQAFKFYER